MGTAAAAGEAFVDEILQLYEQRGSRRYAERLSQTDHAVQTALLAEGEGADDALVAAALLHDVGHLLGADPGRRSATVDDHHESVGARVLAAWFGPALTAPVALHVAAKRYLVTVDPDYFDTLSTASVHTLELQGGALPAPEAARFEAQRHADDAVRLRRWDDRGKVPERVVPDLAGYRPLLLGLLRD